jgi:hypothetical protein
MSHDLGIDRRRLRGIDSNSLLRLYDLARTMSARSSSQQDRAAADKAVQRIAQELKKRGIPLQ